MENLIEISKYILPSVIVFLAVYIVQRHQIKLQYLKDKTTILLNNRKTIIPIKLQAYERLVLFLERISIEALVMRLQRPNLKAIELQKKLLSTIRTEFDHNISQQLYVSNEAWQYVKNARENIVKLINSCAEENDPNKSSMHLSQMLLEESVGDRNPSKKAIVFLKSEIKDLLR